MIKTPVQAFCTQECFDKKRSTQQGKMRKRGKSKTSKARGVPKKISTAVKKRDGNKCRVCAQKDSRAWPLAQHHIIYRSESPPPCGLHSEENLVTLCIECHDKVHSNKNLHQPVLLEYVNEPGFIILKEED